MVMRPTKEQFYEDYCKMSLKSMSEKYGVSDVSICKWRRRFGIEPKGEYFPIHDIHFTERQLQIIHGLLVGDGYIAIPTNSVNPQLSVEHSTKQEDYLKWLHAELSPHSKPITYRTVSPRIINGYQLEQEQYSCRFRTVCHPELVDIYEAHYKDKKRVVNRKVLDNINELGLAIWFMDDGSHNRKSLNFSIRKYPDEHLKQVLEWFKERWDLECRLSWSGHCYRITFTVANSAKLADIIRPHVIPSMAYKLDI